MITRSTFPAIRAAGRDHMVVMDAPGFAELARAAGTRLRENGDWSGSLTRARAIACIDSGDLSMVAASDAMLDRFTNVAPITRRRRTVDAVAGGAPNVGAFLAGSPLAMRRRETTSSDVAPLTIIADIMASGGIATRDMEKRGSAILALVRVLSASRPVTLYVSCAGTAKGNTDAHMLAVRLDTQPLDLARAAYLLAHPAAARLVAYGIIRHEARSDNHVNWMRNDVDAYRENAVTCYARALDLDPAQTLFIPPVFLHDDAVNNPEKWLLDMLAKYGGATLEA